MLPPLGCHSSMIYATWYTAEENNGKGCGHGFHVRLLLMCFVYDLAEGGVASGSSAPAEPAGSVAGGSSSGAEAESTPEVVAQPDGGLASGSG